MAVSIWPLLTAESAAVPSAIFLISVPPALIPSVVMEIAEAPVPLGVMVTPSPLITVVLPPAVVKVADVKPLNTFASRIFNVPAPSDTTPILPVLKSAGVVTPPLMDNTSPCLRTDVVPVSPANLCSASAKACVVLAFALVTASLIAVATFCVVATPLEPVAPDTPVVPAAPTCPLAVTTKLPVFTSTVYVFTPPVVLSDTVASPVPATFTASCAAPLAKFLITVSPLEEILDKFLFAAFSAAATALVNLAVGVIDTLSPVAVVVIKALAPVSPLILKAIALVLSFFAEVEPESPTRAMVFLPNAAVASEAAFTASSICCLFTADVAVVPVASPLISLLPALIPLVLSMDRPPTVTLSKDTFLAVPIVIIRPVLVTAMLSPLTKFTVSPPDTAVVPLPFVDTFQAAAVFAKFLMYVLPAVDKLDKSLFAAFSAAVTAAVNLFVGAMVTSSPLADVEINALVPVWPLMLNLTSPEANFLAVVDPVEPPRAIVRLTAVDESVIDCCVVVFKS